MIPFIRHSGKDKSVTIENRLLGAREVLVTKGWGNVFGLTDMFYLDCGGAAMTEFVNFAELYTIRGVFYCMQIIP